MQLYCPHDPLELMAFHQAEREEVRAEMMSAPVDRLLQPLTEPQIIHKLIAQYLAHDGYIETARAFAAEVRQEHHNLAVGTTSTASSQDLEPEEDVDAIHRQSKCSCGRSTCRKRSNIPGKQRYVQPY